MQKFMSYKELISEKASTFCSLMLRHTVAQSLLAQMRPEAVRLGSTAAISQLLACHTA